MRKEVASPEAAHEALRQMINHEGVFAQIAANINQRGEVLYTSRERHFTACINEHKGIFAVSVDGDYF